MGVNTLFCFGETRGYTIPFFDVGSNVLAYLCDAYHDFVGGFGVVSEA